MGTVPKDAFLLVPKHCDPEVCSQVADLDLLSSSDAIMLLKHHVLGSGLALAI